MDRKLKPTRFIETVVMVIRSYALKANTANQFKHIEVKTLSTNSWKICLKRLSIVKRLLRKSSTNH